jgi:hypothetical protein
VIGFVSEASEEELPKAAAPPMASARHPVSLSEDEDVVPPAKMAKKIMLPTAKVVRLT